MSTAVTIPPRPMPVFGASETITFTNRQAAFSYIESRVWAYMRAHGSSQAHPDYAEITENVTDRVYGDGGKTVSLRKIETLVQHAVVSVLY